MKTWSSALAAFALASFATALVSAPARALQRRTDVPPLAPCPSNDYKPYTYVGCFFEDNPTALQFSSNLVFGEMTVETCTATCKSNGFKYAALIYHGYCRCGTQLPSPAPEAGCNTACNGDPSKNCGGNQRFSIWEDSTYPTVDLATVASQFESLGCYTEGLTGRTLPYRQNQLDFGNLTPEACIEACGQQSLPYAGTEFGGECFCGVQLLDGSTPALSSECNFACSGDDTQTCGGSNRLNVYEAKILQSSEPCGFVPPPPPPPPSSSSSSSPPSSSSSSSPPSSSSSSSSSSSLAPSPTPSPPKACWSHAYGYIPGKSRTFTSLKIRKTWGWVLTGEPPLSGTLYMSERSNDIKQATAVGTFTIAVVGKQLVVIYKTTDKQYSLAQTHLYNDVEPPESVVPGRFGNKHDTLAAGTSQDKFTIPYDSSKKTYILHAAIRHACLA